MVGVGATEHPQQDPAADLDQFPGYLDPVPEPTNSYIDKLAKLHGSARGQVGPVPIDLPPAAVGLEIVLLRGGPATKGQLDSGPLVLRKVIPCDSHNGAGCDDGTVLCVVQNLVLFDRCCPILAADEYTAVTVFHMRSGFELAS